jgi:hypothetical protein
MAIDNEGFTLKILTHFTSSAKNAAVFNSVFALVENPRGIQ